MALPSANGLPLTLGKSGRTCLTPTLKVWAGADLKSGGDFSDVLTLTIVTTPRRGPAAAMVGRAVMLAAALCCVLMPAAGMALACSLSHAEIWLRGDGRTSRLYAENTGDSTLYLDVEQRLLGNPGEQPEVLTPISEVRDPTLLVAPWLALAPGQRAPITLKELARPDSPRVWRVTPGRAKSCWRRTIRPRR